jgi:hypothetical protein
VVLAAAAKVIEPDPLPLAPDVTVSQAALLLAVQAQPPGAATGTFPVPPAAGMPWLVAERENVQGVAGSCVTVKTSSAMVSLATRVKVVELAAAANATVPDPLPLAPLVTASHAESLAAVQGQLPSESTATEPVPPAAGSDWPGEASEGEQVGRISLTVSVA